MNQFVPSDPDEIFSKSPNVLKYTENPPTYHGNEISDNQNGVKENKLVKTKKSVPSNITCHCAGIT